MGVLARFSRKLPRWWRHEGGTISTTVALACTGLIGLTALSIDGASYFNMKRRQQSATDFAALAGAANLSNASTSARQAAVANGYGASSVSAVDFGVYTPDASIAPNKRFTASPVGGNAVRVTMQTQPPFIFGKALQMLTGATSTEGFPIRTSGVALNRSVASFGLGSTLAKVDSGLLNTLLGKMLGASLSLSALDYDNLLSTKVDLFSFADKLATTLNASGGSYDSLLALSTSQNQIFSALQTLAQGTPAATAVTSLVSSLAARGLNAPNLTLSKMISFGSYGARVVQPSHPVAASVSVLDLVPALARLSADGQVITAPVNVAAPGVASAQVTLILGQPARQVTLDSVGPIGTTLYSAQTRLVLTLNLLGNSDGSVVNLPIYLQLAPASAQLQSITCPDATTASSVTLGVTPGLVDAWIGKPSDADLKNFSATPSVSPAVLLNLLLIKVTASGQAGIHNLSKTNVFFSAGDIQAVTKKETSTTNYVDSLIHTLLGSMSVNVSLLGPDVLGLGTQTPRTVLSNESSIDQVLAMLLTNLGLSLGNATTWVSGVKCGQASIVN